jgi:hypothetical protein
MGLTRKGRELPGKRPLPAKCPPVRAGLHKMPGRAGLYYHYKNGKTKSGFTPGLAIIFRREYNVADFLMLLYIYTPRGAENSINFACRPPHSSGPWQEGRHDSSMDTSIGDGKILGKICPLTGFASPVENYTLS